MPKRCWKTHASKEGHSGPAHHKGDFHCSATFRSAAESSGETDYVPGHRFLRSNATSTQRNVTSELHCNQACNMHRISGRKQSWLTGLGVDTGIAQLLLKFRKNNSSSWTRDHQDHGLAKPSRETTDYVLSNPPQVLICRTSCCPLELSAQDFIRHQLSTQLTVCHNLQPMLDVFSEASRLPFPPAKHPAIGSRCPWSS